MPAGRSENGSPSAEARSRISGVTTVKKVIDRPFGERR